MIKSYSGMLECKTYLERLNYLYIGGTIGAYTFGSLRFLNQDFYRSKEWKAIRRYVLMRDDGCDLSCQEHDILGRTLIHHIDPVTRVMIQSNSSKLLDPDNLVTCSLSTHKAIHYGGSTDETLGVPKITTSRSPNDTKLW